MERRSGTQATVATDSRSMQRVRRFCCQFGCWCLLTGLLWGADGRIAVFPAAGAKVYSNLRLEVCARWPGNQGYRPVRVRANNLRPARSDRTLTVTVQGRGTQAYQRLQQASATLVVDAKTSTGWVDILVPVETTWQGLQLEVRENGRLLEDVSTGGTAGQPWFFVQYGQGTHENPAILIIDRGSRPLFSGPATPVPGPMAMVPGVAGIPTAMSGGASGLNESADSTFDFGRLAPLLATDSWERSQELFQVGTYVARQGNAAMERLPSLDSRLPEELPTSWLAYESIDFIVTSWPDLQRVMSVNPEAWRAMRNAVAGGTNLLVFGLGDGYGQLGELESQLAIPPRSSVGAAEEVDPLAAWELPRAELFNLPVTIGHQYGVLGTQPIQGGYGEGRIAGLGNHQRAGLQLPSVIVDMLRSLDITVPPTVGDEPVAVRSMNAAIPFQVRQLGFGRVVALADDELFSARDPNWDWVLRQLGTNHYLWGTRHGFLSESGTSIFWDFLVPGVGAAPVKSYLGMITVFAILIGPVNYWVLRRAGRLSMLLLTVPAGALLVTCGLFLYALVVDGLGAKLHVRSYTDLNGPDGHAVSWSRQCYYAGIAPSDGLQFDDATAISPMYPEDPQYRDGGGWLVRWSEGRQGLEEGFISSRAMRQFMVVHNGPAELRLVAGADPRKVNNRLGVPIRFLIARAADGTLQCAENVPVDGEFTLYDCDEKVFRRAISQFLSDRQPKTPAAIDSLQSTGAWVRGFRTNNQLMTGITFYDSLLEVGITDLIGTWQSLEPGMYWAISTERPVTVPIGIRRGQELESLHVIRGAW